MAEKTFKERLVEIYNELDSVNIDALQEEIDKIKKEIQIIIECCDEAELTHEQTILQGIIEQKSMYGCLPHYRSKTKQIVIQKACKEKNDITIKDISLMILLIIAISVITVCLTI